MDHLIVFVKAPVPGRVKTRLVPPLTHVRAAELYKEWARETFRTSVGLAPVSVEVAYDAHPDFPTPDWLVSGGGRVSYFHQRGNDLGEKLIHALRRAFEQGHERAVVIGTDSPGLPSDYIERAFESLENADVVLGPTPDGGYYLVGLKEKIDDALFTGISWSTSVVFSQTVEQARKLGLKTHILQKYFDIDVAEDLKYLEGKGAPL